MCGGVRVEDDDSELKIRLTFDPDAPAPNFERDWNIPLRRPMLARIYSAARMLGEQVGEELQSRR